MDYPYGKSMVEERDPLGGELYRRQYCYDDSKTSINSYHARSVLLVINEHRKTHQKLCDVMLKVESREFPAHRSVLAACSSYFLAMFSVDMAESKQREIVLRDVNPELFEMLLDFAYTGNLNVEVDNVQSLLSLASLLQFQEACNLCCRFLERQLEPCNCLGIRKYVQAYGCDSFTYLIDRYILRNFCEVMKGDEHYLMPYEVLSQALQSDSLCVKNEEQVYEALVKWVRYDLPSRGHQLPSLLAHVRLPLISVKYLVNEISSETLIKSSMDCRDFIDEAKNYHLEQEQQQKLKTLRTKPRKSTVGTMYAVGGKKTGEAITQTVERYSMYLDSWTHVGSLNVARQQLGVCEYSGRLFAIGGSDGLVRLSSVEVLNADESRWQYVKSLSVCRSGVGVGVLGDSLFALGGYDGRICLNSVERYDAANNQWLYVSATNATRSFPGVSVVGKRLFVVGGNDGSSFLSSCEVYDPLTNQWSPISPMSRPRAGVGAAAINGCLYVAGGFDGTSRLDLVEMYDPRMNKWMKLTPMMSCRDGVCMASYGCCLFAVGGIDGPSYLNTVEYYDPQTSQWHESVGMAISRAAAGVAVLPPLN